MVFLDIVGERMGALLLSENEMVRVLSRGVGVPHKRVET
jgi:hypothetical protein